MPHVDRKRKWIVLEQRDAGASGEEDDLRNQGAGGRHPFQQDPPADWQHSLIAQKLGASERSSNRLATFFDSPKAWRSFSLLATFFDSPKAWSFRKILQQIGNIL